MGSEAGKRRLNQTVLIPIRMSFDELGHGLLERLRHFRLETHNTDLSRGLLKAFRHLFSSKRTLVLHTTAPPSRTPNTEAISRISKQDPCQKGTPALVGVPA